MRQTWISTFEQLGRFIHGRLFLGHFHFSCSHPSKSASNFHSFPLTLSAFISSSANSVKRIVGTASHEQVAPQKMRNKASRPTAPKLRGMTAEGQVRTLRGPTRKGLFETVLSKEKQEETLDAKKGDLQREIRREEMKQKFISRKRWTPLDALESAHHLRESQRIVSSKAEQLKTLEKQSLNRSKMPYVRPPRPEEAPCHLPYLLRRTTLGLQLPIYTEYKNQGARVFTVVRRIEGDVKSLAEQFRRVLPHNTMMEIREDINQIRVKGRHTRVLNQLLSSQGF